MRGLQVRRRADRRLQRPSLASVVRLVEDAVCGRDQPVTFPGWIEGDADARSKSFLERRNQTGGNSGIAGIQQVFGSIRHDHRLAAGDPEGLAIVDLGIGKGQFVAQAKVQRQARGHLVGVLRVSVQAIAANATREVATALQEDNRLTEKEGGKAITDDGKSGIEHKEAVGRDALQRVDIADADIRRRT